MKQKLLSLLLVAVMVTGIITGCGNGSSSSSADTPDNSGGEKTIDANDDGTINNPEAVEIDENKLVLWSLFSGGDGEFMDKIIEQYNSSEPSKQVQSIMLVWADYYTKLQTAVAGGKGPDIGISHASKLAELVDQGVVEPIDPYLDELGIDMKSMYSENSLEAVTFDGKYYGVPLDTHAEIIFYNKTILEKAGVELNENGQLDISNWDDFKSILDKCKAVIGDGESVIALPNTGDDPYRIWWATYFQMGGTPLVNDEGTEVTFDKEIAKKAAAAIKSWYDDGYVLEGIPIDENNPLFQSGKAAFTVSGTWVTGAFEQMEDFEFGVQAWPALYGSDSCWADSHTLILPVNPERSEEDTLSAVEFLVGASDNGGSIWAGSGQIPSSQKVLESQEYQEMPYRSNYKSALDTAVMPAKNPHFYAMKAAIIENLDGYWTEVADVDTAIDGISNELELNLK